MGFWSSESLAGSDDINKEWVPKCICPANPGLPRPRLQRPGSCQSCVLSSCIPAHPLGAPRKMSHAWLVSQGQRRQRAGADALVKGTTGASFLEMVQPAGSFYKPQRVHQLSALSLPPPQPWRAAVLAPYIVVIILE